MLEAEVPLLHVGPVDLVGDGDGRNGAGRALRAGGHIAVADDVADSSVGRKRRSALLEKLGVGFVAVHVLEEDAVAATNGPLAVAKGIVSKADTRAWIDPLVVQTTSRARGYTRDGGMRLAALSESVEEGLTGSDIQYLRSSGSVK